MKLNRDANDQVQECQSEIEELKGIIEIKDKEMEHKESQI